MKAPSWTDKPDYEPAPPVDANPWYESRYTVRVSRCRREPKVRRLRISKGDPVARLTSKARKALPDSAFAIPSERKYPIQNPSHQRNALARVSEFGSSAEKKAVRTAVHRRNPSIGKRG